MSDPRHPTTRLVALDGGTSTTRARLVDGGRIVAEARRAVGVRDAAIAGQVSTVVEAVRGCLDDLDASHPGAVLLPIVAAGMLSSEVGLASVPHVVAPAGLREIAIGTSARVVPGVSEAPILFIPGVRTPSGTGPDGWAESDVMRGEECETLGVLQGLGLSGPLAMLWPGSHTKLVAVDADGRITRSHTTLAGELTVALARQTLLAGSLPENLPDEPDADAVALGASLAAREGLGRAAFLVRLAHLSGSLDLVGRASFLIGAVIGDDVANLARHPILEGGVPVWVGGREPQRSIYVAALQVVRDGPVSRLDDDVAGLASVMGALAVASEAGWLKERTGSSPVEAAPRPDDLT
jgi:2-dehydro-3-deoxygalactonokinase